MKVIHQGFVFGVLVLQVSVSLSSPVIEPGQYEDGTELLPKLIHPPRAEDDLVSAGQEIPSDSSALVTVLLGGNGINATGLHRHKQTRSWAAAVFKGLMVAEHLTNLGLNLAQAVEGGCVYYPSICTDKTEIEKLDKHIQTNLDKFDAEYKRSKIDFLALRTVSNNNAYINYYINSTLRAVEDLQEMQQTILLQLEVEFPELARIAESGNQTANAYLKSILGPLEFTLSDINKMLKQQRKAAFIGLVIEVSVQSLINNFMKSYQKAYNAIQGVEKLAMTKSYFSVLEENGVTLEPHIRQKYVDAEHVSTTFLEDIKTSPKVLGKMMKSTFIEKPKNLANAVVEMGSIKSWEGFKDTFSHVLKKPLSTLDKVHQFFVDPTFRKFTIDNFKVGWTEGLMSGITVLSDAISQAMAAKQYSEAADQVAKSKKQYKEYDDKLTKELAEIQNETKNMNAAWLEVMDTFRNSSLIFKNLVQNALNYSDFSHAMGEANLGVDLNNPLFNTNFDNVQRSNLEGKQNAVIGYLKSVHNDMQIVMDKLRSRQTLYSIVLNATKGSSKLADILKNAHQAYAYDPSEIVKSYGHNLTEQDIVCSVAILRPTLNVYDSFQLVTFRPSCNVTPSAFASMKTAAQKKQLSTLLFQTVSTNVRALGQLENLDIVYNLIVNQYAHGDASKVSRDDVLCAIAHEFPSKNSYNDHPLSSFRSRPECSPE